MEQKSLFWALQEENWIILQLLWLLTGEQRGSRRQEEAKQKGGRWEAEAKITGKEMLQGRCLLQVKRGTLTNIFRSLLQSWYIWENFAVLMGVTLRNFQLKSTTCHRFIPTFKSNWFHPVTSLKQDRRSQIFCCPQGQLVQPCVSKREIGNKQPESRFISWNTNKKINLAETSAVVPEHGQHPSNTWSSCLWFAWNKN